MSSGTLVVRFADGTFRYGVYHGTSDLAFPRLSATVDEAWNSRVASDPEPSDERPEPVEVATNYGGGLWWKGEATTRVLVTTDPYGQMLEHPAAAPGACDEYRRRVDTRDGYPDWWELSDAC